MVLQLVQEAGALYAQNKPREALEQLIQAQNLEPHYANAHLGEAVARLMLGSYQTGFRKLEYRYYCQYGSQSIRRPFLNPPFWRGDPSKAGASFWITKREWERRSNSCATCRWSRRSEAMSRCSFQTFSMPCYAQASAVSSPCRTGLFKPGIIFIVRFCL